MAEGFSLPLDDTLRILTDYDTTVIQVARVGTEISEDPVILAYQYIEVRRDLCDAGGEDYIRDVLKSHTNGRLYLKLWRLMRHWDSREGIRRQLVDLVDHKFNHSSPGEFGFVELARAYRDLLAALMIEAKAALELRREIRSGMDNDFFGKDTLYRLMVLNQQRVTMTKRLVQDTIRKWLYEEDWLERSEQLWEARCYFDECPGVPDLDRLEPVEITVGAVSPDYVHDQPRLLEDISRDYGTQQHFKDATPEALLEYKMDHCISTGNRVPLESQTFLDERDGLPWALATYLESKFMLGFWLDRGCNALGASGWSFLKGDPTGRIPIE